MCAPSVHKCVVVVAAHCLPIASSRVSDRSVPGPWLSPIRVSELLVPAAATLLANIVKRQIIMIPPFTPRPAPFPHLFPLIVNWFVTIIVGGAFDLYLLFVW